MDILARLLKGKRGAKVLSFGHPDILALPEELAPIFGQMLAKDNAGVLASRKQHPNPNIVGSAKIVFRAMSAELHVIDKSMLYGVDETGDMNLPIAPQHHGAYDLVVDPGTTEHCFNVAQALKNAAEAVAVGGHIYHMVPLCHWNHGFWNFSPGVFADFYDSDNGFEVIRLEGIKRHRWVPVHAHGKFEIENHGRKLNLLCIARKIAAVPIKYPIQFKYREMLRS